MRAAPPTCILFIGIPASGKSSFYKARFADTHVRLNQDMLRTPYRLRVLRDACLAAGASFVLDNTNVTRAGRAEHVAAARRAGFRVEGYFLASAAADALARNQGRAGRARVPDAAVRGMRARLEPPAPDEGFDALFLVRLLPGGGFDVREWTPAAGAHAAPEE
ncbi:MAG TPA: ATP-binding protein [Anaeromyxobacter sp.]|nr:ATP-binding protein [Anaeromyxobacter sp.]